MNIKIGQVFDSGYIRFQIVEIIPDGYNCVILINNSGFKKYKINHSFTYSKSGFDRDIRPKDLIRIQTKNCKFCLCFNSEDYISVASRNIGVFLSGCPKDLNVFICFDCRV